MRWRTVVSAALLSASLACIDMSAPNGGVLSISPVQLPSPSIVVGDVMRDSLGNPAPISVAAFDASGDTVSEPAPIFTVRGRGMHLNADGVLVGDSISSPSVVGGVSGLTSRADTVPVTFPPDSATANAPDTLRIVLSEGDTLVSGEMTVTLTGHNGLGSMAGPDAGGAQGFIVTYAVVHAPGSFEEGKSTVSLTNGTRASAVDTTDASGVASRKAALTLSLIANQGLLQGTSSDSIVVDATVNPRGRTVLPSPVLRFVIRVSK